MEMNGRLKAAITDLTSEIVRFRTFIGQARPVGCRADHGLGRAHGRARSPDCGLLAPRCASGAWATQLPAAGRAVLPPRPLTSVRGLQKFPSSRRSSEEPWKITAKDSTAHRMRLAQAHPDTDLPPLIRHLSGGRTRLGSVAWPHLLLME